MNNTPVTRQPAIFMQFPELVAGITLSPTSLHELAQPFTQANYGLSPHYRNYSDEQQQTAIIQTLDDRRNLTVHLLGDNARATFVQQAHTNNVIVAPQGGDINLSTEADGIITQQSHHLLCVMAADCALILLYDPNTKIIAAIHSGWRGTKANIVRSAAKEFEALGATMKDVFAYISPTPGICGKHYPVYDDFVSQFDKKYFIQYNGRPVFDNAAAVRDQLIELGVKNEHIETDQLCTVEDERLHSHRRDGAGAGRYVGFIGLKV